MCLCQPPTAPCEVCWYVHCVCRLWLAVCCKLLSCVLVGVSVLTTAGLCLRPSVPCDLCGFGLQTPQASSTTYLGLHFVQCEVEARVEHTELLSSLMPMWHACSKSLVHLLEPHGPIRMDVAVQARQMMQ